MNAVTHTHGATDMKGFAVFIVWAVIYMAARGLLELETLNWWARLGIALAPVPAFAWVLWSVIKGIASLDELQRRIQLEALAFAFPLTLLLIMTLGLLEIAVGLNPDDWSYRHVWPVLVALYFAGLFRAKRYYES